MTNLAAVFIGVAMFSSFLGVAGFVQAPEGSGFGFGASVLAASMYLMPGTVIGVVISPIAGRFVHRRGGRIALLVGALTGAVGFAFMFGWHDSPWQIVVGSVVVSSAVSIAFASMPALIIQAVDPAETGIANSINSIARSTGSAVASALAVTLMASIVIPGTLLPAENAYLWVFGMGVMAFLGAAALVLFGLPRHQVQRPDPFEDEEDAVSLAGPWATVSGLD